MPPPCACVRQTEREPSSQILERMGETEAALDRTVEAAKSFKESLAGSLEEKQKAVAQAMLKIGPPAWRISEKFCHVLPCDHCEQDCVHMERARHDIVNAKRGVPLHDPENFARFKAHVAAIQVPGAGEAINIQTHQAHADSKMAFTLKGKQNEIVRLWVAGGVGGGVGFALVDRFAVQTARMSPNAKDAIHAGIGLVVSLAGAYANKLWLGELGAGYLAVPISRLTQRNALGGVPVGEVGIGQVIPAGQAFPSGVIADGRTGAITTTVAGVKTF